MYINLSIYTSIYGSVGTVPRATPHAVALRRACRTAAICRADPLELLERVAAEARGRANVARAAFPGAAVAAVVVPH